LPERVVVRLQPRAATYYQSLQDDERRRLESIFEAIEINPYVDNYWKFTYTRLIPAICTVWVDDEFEVVYQLVDHIDPPTGLEAQVLGISKRSA
jgi:hypothetical protein